MQFEFSAKNVLALILKNILNDGAETFSITTLMITTLSIAVKT
jgi:hypothetical protein